MPCCTGYGRLTTVTTRPASPAQLRFIRDLLAARPATLAAYGVTTVDAAIDLLAANPAFTTREASGMIDQLKAIPVEAPVPAAAGIALPDGAKVNRFAGKCVNCKGNVPEQGGYFLRDGAGKVRVYHVTCEAPATAAPAVPAAEVPVGLYCHQDGPEVEVWRVYVGRQSGRRQAARLTVHGDHGAFEYVKGGTRMVDTGVATGALRLVTEQEAHAFGSLHNWCVNCGLAIEDDRSIAAGYGPVCADNNGWHYPTYQEAANVLQRPVSRPSGGMVVPA